MIGRECRSCHHGRYVLDENGQTVTCNRCGHSEPKSADRSIDARQAARQRIADARAAKGIAEPDRQPTNPKNSTEGQHR